MIEIGARHWLTALLGAVVLHASALLAFWEPSAVGAPVAGSNGIEVSLGPAGAAAGSAAAVENVDAVAPVAAPQLADEVATEAAPTTVPVQTATPVIPEEAVPVVEEVAPSAPEPLVKEVAPSDPQPVVEPTEVAEAEAVAPETEVEMREPPPLPEIPPAKPEPPRQVAQPQPQPPAAPAADTQAVAPAAVAPVAGAAQLAALPGNAGRSGDTEATATGSGNMTPGGGVPGAAGNDYGKLLSAWIQKHHEFPDRAQRRRQYGEALVRFAIDRSGKLLHFEVVSSSGYRLLDEAALDTMKRADPLPPIPAEMPGADYTNTIRITFDPPG